MTVMVERAIVVAVRIEADTLAAADEAFASLGTRIRFALPKRRFGAVRLVWRRVVIHATSGTVSKVGAVRQLVYEEGDAL